MIKNATFLISNTDISKCPAPTKPEFAFIGRSNVGKSSLINMLTGNKNLAKTSGRPGKTQLINHFNIDDKWYMVDLPGYGFAKVSKTLKDDWNKMIRKYLVSRENLMVVFVLIDSRLDPQKVDLDFITWCGQNEVPIVLLFTKADKQSNSKNKMTVSKFLQATEMIFEEAPLFFITSATSGDGKEEVVDFIQEQVSDYYSKQN
jgi:GTP-binding protein